MGVEIHVLGPLAVIDAAEAGPTKLGPALRRLLALLCVHAGTVVSTERLAEDLGLSTTNAIRTTVSRIRNVVGDLLLFESPGYMIEAEAVDSRRFAALLDVARSEPVDRIAKYDAALALWHGPAYMEFADEEWATAEAIRLDELRTTAQEERVEALLDADQLDDAVADAGQIVHNNPVRERPRAQLMRALARQGRTTEALRAYQDYRDYLGEEIGVEPSAELAELETQILTGNVASVSRTDAQTATASIQPAGGGADSPIPTNGTLTFLFTDIEGSTQRWEADPDAMDAALQEHDRVLTDAITDHSGWVFKHTGDGVCASFRSAVDAVEAAIHAQGALGLPVRMGIASGEADHRDGDYFGPVMNRVARVMSAGHGGQILMASSAAALVDDVQLRDLGEHELRDLAAPMRLYQVEAPGLPSDFAPLQSLTDSSGNLPTNLNSFFGRETDIERVNELLGEHVLVTLTGAGGVGKTRLSLQVARSNSDNFPDGVWFVELAALDDPDAVAAAFANTLGINARPDESLVDTVASSLAGRRALLVVDNCEHVLETAGDVVDAILQRSDGIHVLATSRQGLGLPVEHVWSVSPLDSDAGEESPAVQLFVDRAQAASSDFVLTDAAQTQAVAEICRRLDGLALAIELASARMVSMTVEEVRDRLDDSFRVLIAPGRTMPHHQTLGHAISWSYDLLDANERLLLNHCAIFQDGFDLTGAAALVADRLDEYDVMDLLDSLIRKSLLTTERVAGRTRHGMLETIRQFCQQRLDESGQIEDARKCHAAHFAAKAYEYRQIFDSPRDREATEWFEIEFANLRSAFRWAMRNSEIDIAAGIAADSVTPACMVQRLEPVEWAEEVLPLAIEADAIALQRVYQAASTCVYQGRAEDALAYGQAARSLQENPRYDSTKRGWAGLNIAVSLRWLGRMDECFSILSEMQTLTGMSRVVGLSGTVYGLAINEQFEQAQAMAEEALVAARALEIPFFVALALDGYGRACTKTDPDLARSIYRECLEYASDHRLEFFVSIANRESASLQVGEGDIDAALQNLEAAIDSFRSGNANHLGASLAKLAMLFSSIGESDVAATVYGATSLSDEAGALEKLPQLADRLKEALGEVVFHQRAASGAAMSQSEAIDFAHRHIDLARSAIA